MRPLRLRLGLALLLAALLSAGLYWYLNRPQPGEAAWQDSAVRPARIVLPTELPAGRAWLLYLSDGSRPLPRRVAPVARLGADGEIELLRGAPLPEGPTVTAWLAVGIELPAADIEELSPRAQAAMLELWRGWSGSGDIAMADAAVDWGVRVDRRQLRRLQRWMR